MRRSPPPARSLLRRALIPLLTVGLLLLALCYRLVVQGGLLLDIAHQAPGPCRPLTGVPGPEDFALDRERGVLYISSHDRRQPATQGAIYQVELRHPLTELRAVRLPGDYPQDFHPHGLSLLVRPGGARRLYVVSHPGAGHGSSSLDFGDRHRIELLDIGAAGLQQAGALTGPELQNPNDLHVLAEDDLYVTRDHGATSAGGRTVEDVLGLRRSSVLHYDGRRFQVAVTGLGYANGITGRAGRLFVAAVLDRAIHEYAIDGPGRLRPLRLLPLPAGPDNLEPDEAGDLWLGAHPAPVRFLLHAHDPGQRSPSQVLRVPLSGGAPQVVYADPGAELSGSSVAVRAEGLLLIGAVFSPHALACAAP